MTLDRSMVEMAIRSLAFHIEMGRGNFDNPFQYERQKALEYWQAKRDELDAELPRQSSRCEIGTGNP